jgi:hypothetical protein
MPIFFNIQMMIALWLQSWFPWLDTPATPQREED